MPKDCVVDGRAWLYNNLNTEVYPAIESVDHVITDPPYGKYVHTDNRFTRNQGGEITNVIIPFEKLEDADLKAFIDLCKKVKGWAITFCEAEQTGTWRDAFDAAKLKDRPPMVWVKPDAQPQFNGNGPAVGTEHIALAWCGEGRSKWNGGGKHGVYTFVKRHTFSGHPTEKPLPLMRQLISDFTNPGDTVLDPFMGSGSTGVACLELGRKFIGIEMNEEYYAIAVRRIEAAAKVVSLVTPKPQTVALFEGSKYRRAPSRRKEKV